MTEKEIHSLREIVQYNWRDEYRDFLDTFELEYFSSNDALEDWIEVCEKTPNFKTHIFYHLMVVRNSSVMKG